MQKGMKDHGQGLKIGIEIEIAIVIGIGNGIEIGNEREIRKATEDDQGLLLILSPSKEFHNKQVWADACTKSRMMAWKKRTWSRDFIVDFEQVFAQWTPSKHLLVQSQQLKH